VFRKLEIHDHLNASLFFTQHGIADDSDMTVKKQFCEECIHVRGDNELLKQMSMNILLIAVQATAGDGELTITTRIIKDVPDGKTYVEICYKDTGKGIPPGDMKKVFDPYFTTKSNGRGMGLSVVHNIVSLHGGTVQVRNRQVKGTAVVVVLPAYETNDKRRGACIRK
jgi:signal transduction histidine kinase